MKRVATKEPPRREPEAAQETVFFDSEPGVLRAGRRKPAGARQERRQQPLVGNDHAESDPHPGRHGRGPGMAVSAPPSSAASAGKGTRKAPGRPMITSAVCV